MSIRERLEEIVVERDIELTRRAERDERILFVDNLLKELLSFDETSAKKQLCEAVRIALVAEAFDASIKIIPTSNSLIIQLLNTKDIHELGGFKFPTLIDVQLMTHDIHLHIKQKGDFPEKLVELIIDALIYSTIVFDD